MRSALACGMVLVTLTGAASAAARPRVLLVLDRPDDPFIERIRAEISELDIDVIDRDANGPLDAAARREGAAAAIRILPAQNGVEVWMADATSGRSLLRQVIVDESRSGPNQSLVALQTAELLRTSLLYERTEAPRARPAAERDPGPRGASSDRDSPALPEPAAQVALGALYSPGGAGANLQLGLSLRWPLQRWLAVALDASLPIQSAEIDGPEGSAQLRAYLAGAGLSAHTRAGHDWAGAIGAGAGVLHVSADARAAEPLEARGDAALAGATYVWADGTLGVAPWLRVGLRSLVGVTLPRVAVEFAGNRAGSWGAPFLGASALTELSWR